VKLLHELTVMKDLNFSVLSEPSSAPLACRT